MSESKEQDHPPSKAHLLKRPRFLNQAVRKWVNVPFSNPARGDNLKLNHWIPQNKVSDSVYPFSRLNKV